VELITPPSFPWQNESITNELFSAVVIEFEAEVEIELLKFVPTFKPETSVLEPESVIAATLKYPIEAEKDITISFELVAIAPPYAYNHCLLFPPGERLETSVIALPS